MILQILWLAAISYLRKHPRCADHAQRWREVHDITEALGFPPSPRGPL